MPEYTLASFQVMRFREKWYVLYGFGQWAYHIMDWAGCNFHHGRLPDSPVFKSAVDALSWLKSQVLNGKYSSGMECIGHHAGGNDECHPCKDREVSGLDFIGYTDLGLLKGTIITKEWSDKKFQGLLDNAQRADREQEKN